MKSTVTIVSYPLAPNSSASSSMPHLARLYPTLLQQAAEADEEVVMMGDSAGANVALSLVLLILSQDSQAPVPATIFLISPVVDCQNSNPAMSSTDKKDPVLTAKYTGQVAEGWCGKGKVVSNDPLVSPLFGNLEALKRRSITIHGVVGTYDVLAPDALLLLEKLEELRVDGSWLVWDKQMHCFPLAWCVCRPASATARTDLSYYCSIYRKYGLSDSRSAKDWIVQTVQA